MTHTMKLQKKNMIKSHLSFTGVDGKVSKQRNENNLHCKRMMFAWLISMLYKTCMMG